MMKVVIIGGGAIAGHLQRSVPFDVDLSLFSIRSLSVSSLSWTNVLDKCANADLVIYLAYHHRDLPKNVKLLWRVLSGLSDKKWSGNFIFFNTQSLLVRDILKGPRPILNIYCFDLYTTTKRLQTFILGKFASKIKVFEIYLPVVLGIGTKAQQRYTEIAKHKIIYLPNEGKNTFVFLEISCFVTWFWNVYVNDLKKGADLSDRRREFVYEGIASFADVIKDLRGAAKNYINESSPSNNIIIRSCKYRYRFSDNFLSNFLFGIKLSPVWLILSIARYYVSKVNFFGLRERSLSCNGASDNDVFYPIFAEYQFFCNSTELAKIPFKKTRISA